MVIGLILFKFSLFIKDLRIIINTPCLINSRKCPSAFLFFISMEVESEVEIKKAVNYIQLDFLL